MKSSPSILLCVMFLNRPIGVKGKTETVTPYMSKGEISFRKIYIDD